MKTLCAMLLASFAAGGSAATMVLVAADGCVNGQPAIPPVIGDPAVCILRVMGADLAANMSFEAAALDAAIRCLGSGSKENVARVTNLWAEHKAEELRERDGGNDQ